MFLAIGLGIGIGKIALVENWYWNYYWKINFQYYWYWNCYCKNDFQHYWYWHWSQNFGIDHLWFRNLHIKNLCGYVPENNTRFSANTLRKKLKKVPS